MLKGGLHRLRRDLVERDAMDGNATAALPLGLRLTQFFIQVRCDRFALTIRVRREIDSRGGLRFLLQIRQNFFFSRNDDVLGLEVVLDVDTDLALRQIFHMTQRGFDLVVFTEIFVDRLRLCRRFNDD